MSNENEIKESVEEAKAPGTFNIVNVLQGRGYPKVSVKVYIDEALAFQGSQIKEKIKEVEDSIGTGKASQKEQKQIEDLNSELEEVIEQMEKSAYVFYIRGLSEGKREEIYKEAKKKYPVEYETMPNLSTGAIEKTEKESEDRTNLFTELLWKESIEKISDPDGNEQIALSYTDIKEMRTSLPFSAIARINETIERLRVSTAVFMYETGEDFLAKP